jgi:4'-phosphopantetheinyl transferase EntD
LRELFPPGALAAELRGAGDPAALLPDEWQSHRTAVPKRMQEFAAGRACAHRLLAEFGVVDFSIKAAPDRQPLWPPTLVGSITHTTGFCAAVVAPKKVLGSVGIDSEIRGSVKPELWRSICTASETAWLHLLPDAEQALAATLIFSAKEAFYKCQYPLVAERLSFHDVSIQIGDWDIPEGEFKIHPNRQVALALEQHAPAPWPGRYLFHDEFITTGVALPALR